MGDERRDRGQEPAGEASVPKWGDPLDRLTDERKAELAERLWAWNPEQAAEKQLGPFAGERLDGLEVFWLAACALAGRDGDTAAAQQLMPSSRQSDRRCAGCSSASKGSVWSASSRPTARPSAQSPAWSRSMSR